MLGEIYTPSNEFNVHIIDMERLREEAFNNLPLV